MEPRSVARKVKSIKSPWLRIPVAVLVTVLVILFYLLKHWFSKPWFRIAAYFSVVLLAGFIVDPQLLDHQQIFRSAQIGAGMGVLIGFLSLDFRDKISLLPDHGRFLQAAAIEIAQELSEGSPIRAIGILIGGAILGAVVGAIVGSFTALRWPSIIVILALTVLDLIVTVLYRFHRAKKQQL